VPFGTGPVAAATRPQLDWMLSWSLLVVRLHGDADIDAVTNYDVRRPTSDTDTTVAANDSELRLEARDLHDATQHLLHLRRNVFHAEDGDGQLNHVHPTPATPREFSSPLQVS